MGQVSLIYIQKVLGGMLKSIMPPWRFPGVLQTNRQQSSILLDWGEIFLCQLERKNSGTGDGLCKKEEYRKPKSMQEVPQWRALAESTHLKQMLWGGQGDLLGSPAQSSRLSWPAAPDGSHTCTARLENRSSCSCMGVSGTTCIYYNTSLCILSCVFFVHNTEERPACEMVPAAIV